MLFGERVIVVICYMYNVTPAAELDRLLRISVYLHLNNGVLSFTDFSHSRIPDSGCCHIRLYFIVIRLFFSFCHCFPSFCVCVCGFQREKSGWLLFGLVCYKNNNFMLFFSFPLSLFPPHFLSANSTSTSI